MFYILLYFNNVLLPSMLARVCLLATLPLRMAQETPCSGNRPDELARRRLAPRKHRGNGQRDQLACCVGSVYWMRPAEEQQRGSLCISSG